MRGRGRVRIILLAALYLAAAGCGRASPPSEAPAAGVVDPPALEAVAVEPAWSRSFPEPAAVAVLPDGDGVLVAAPGDDPGRVTLTLLGAGGELRWRQALAVPRGTRPGIAAVEPRADRVAVVAAGDGQGQLLVLTLGGRLLWRQDVPAGVSVRLSPEGTRAAWIDGAGGRLVLLGSEGEEITRLDVAAGATAAFLGDGTLLVNDREQVVALAPDGRVLRRLPVDASLQRQLAVHPDGQRVAVATAGSQDSVYLLTVDVKGRRVEGLTRAVPLYPGGRNRPRFAADGQVLYVYDVGDRAGLYAIATRDLEVAWRLLARRPGWAVAELAAGADGLLARYVPEQAAAGDQLVRIDPRGRPVARLRLPAAERWLLPQGSDRLVVAVTPIRDGTAAVRAYRLDPLPTSR